MLVSPNATTGLLASNVYAGQHPKPQHWVPTTGNTTLVPKPKENPTLVHQTGTTILVPRPKLSIASSDLEFYIGSADWKSYLASYARAYAGGLGLKPPLELDILQKLYYLRKEIKCLFAYFLLVNLST